MPMPMFPHLCLHVLTLDEAAGSARDALDLSDIVHGEILIAGGIEEAGGAEKLPELGANCLVPLHHHLGAEVEAMA